MYFLAAESEPALTLCESCAMPSKPSGATDTRKQPRGANRNRTEQPASLQLFFRAKGQAMLRRVRPQDFNLLNRFCSGSDQDASQPSQLVGGATSGGQRAKNCTSALLVPGAQSENPDAQSRSIRWLAREWSFPSVMRYHTQSPHSARRCAAR